MINNEDFDKPTIIWTPWHDPLINEDSEAILKSLARIHGDEDPDIKTPVKMFIDPILGPIPITDYSQIGRTFKFWMGHTNFSITPKIEEIIEKTVGIETLNTVTRYRFRIGCGMAFKDRTVMNRIIHNIRKKNKKLDILRSIIVESEEKSENNDEDDDSGDKMAYNN